MSSSGAIVVIGAAADNSMSVLRAQCRKPGRLPFSWIGVFISAARLATADGDTGKGVRPVASVGAGRASAPASASPPSIDA